jgi:hypothetical protein
MCGAFVLYLETRLTRQEVLVIREYIETRGRSQALEKAERRSVWIVGLCSCFGMALIVAAAFGVNQNSPNSWRLIVQIEIGIVYAVVTTLMFYFPLKFLKRCLFTKASHLRDQDFNEHDDTIKQVLREIGFLLLFTSGLLQLFDFWFRA